MRWIASVIVAVSFMCLGSLSAQARCWVEWQDGFTFVTCDPGTSEAGYTFSTVQINNACNRTIWVAANYKQILCGELPGDMSMCQGSPTTQWVTRAWWKLVPGQTSYIFDTQNRYFYFYAQDEANALVWSGNEKIWVGQDLLGFFQADLGGRHTNYTQRFTCSR